MELRGCWPALPPGNDWVVPVVDGLTREPEAAASFGFLEGVSEPLLGSEPSMSKSVLWRFPLEVLVVKGVGFGFASSSWSDEAVIVVGFSSREAAVA